MECGHGMVSSNREGVEWNVNRYGAYIICVVGIFHGGLIFAMFTFDYHLCKYI